MTHIQAIAFIALHSKSVSVTNRKTLGLLFPPVYSAYCLQMDKQALRM